MNNQTIDYTAELLEALDNLIGAVEAHCMSDDPDIIEELKAAYAASERASNHER